ncbi:MAG: glycosyltransferase [Oryzomonas sp.]|uniref:glycosyltransferase n=1 Tax=Oryzomonas sp. TaxID=2855186 RepID=UPI0028416A63|nr:glycosyltransferase [Oryzomonas sp.]MDR3581109.1 glycosyltransferase [Oryzomonas sp.]
MERNNFVVYIDCTETICSGINTGIQRTVRNIINRHALISNIYGIKVIPVVALNGKFHKYNVDNDRKMCARFLSKVFGSMRNLLDKICYGKKVNVDALRSISFFDPVSSANTGVKTKTSDVSWVNGIHLHIIEYCRKILPLFFLCAFYLDNAFDEFKEADIASDDIIFYPDAFWHRCTHLTFKRYDAIKILLLYDIIPITMPEVCDVVHITSFKRNLFVVLDNIEGVVSISKSELANIQSYLAASGFNKDLLFDYIYLGADFVATQPDPGSVDPCLIKAFSGQQTFVMVGTLEPRKNHAFVLDAFDRFWREGGEASLCIIGKTSLLCSDLKSRIDRHEYNGSRLFCFQDINDAGVAYSYEKCAGVIFASLAEGFGLPLVEAMWAGRPVFASDIAVFREIGENYPHFFSPVDVHSLVECLRSYLEKPSENCQPKQWVTWDESAQNLFGKIVHMSESVKQKKMLA